MKLRLLALVAAFSLAAGAQAVEPAAAPAKPATIEAERAQVLAWTRDLESAPLAADADAKRSWLVQWVKNVRGLKVHVCDVFGVDQDNKKLGAILLKQYMFGSASYLIGHPSMDGRQTAVQLAGVVSALNAYAVIREQDPTQKVAHFDALLAKQAKGELYDEVETNVFSKCVGH